ncbi:MAG: hypothetical protein AAB506_01125 [Patescibacteria group bacterium]
MTEDLNIADGGEIASSGEKIEFSKPLIIILLIALVFVFALGISLGIVYFTAKKTSPAPSLPQTNPPVFEPVKPKEKSKLATDSAVLKIADDLSAFQQELNRLDLLEPQLAPPSIDLNIKIE